MNNRDGKSIEVDVNMEGEEWWRLIGYGCRGIIEAEGLWKKEVVKVARK